MAKCAYCGADTIMHVDGVPVCVKCDKGPKEKTPQKEPEQPKPAKQRRAN